MKKILYLSLISGLLLGTSACTQTTENENNDKINSGINIEETDKGNTNTDSTELSMEMLENTKAKEEDWTYSIHNGTLFLNEYNGDLEIVVIPDEIDGYPVTKVPADMFRKNNEIKAVKIGKNVKIIEGRAFGWCSNLEYVILGASVEIVENSAFYGLENLKEIKLNEGLLKVEDLSFASNAEVPIIIPRSVNEIKGMAFKSPVKVYKGSYAEQYLLEHEKDNKEFIYEVIE